MHDKYIVTNPNLKTLDCLTNKFPSWLKDNPNFLKRLGDRLKKLIAESDSLQFFFKDRFRNYKKWEDGKNYSFLIFDEDHNRAYVGGRDCPLKLHELIMLPGVSGDEIYQVESIFLLSSDTWVASLKKVIT